MEEDANTTVRRAVAQGYDVLLESSAHTTKDSETLPAPTILAFTNQTLHSFWAGARRVLPEAESLFD